MHRADQADAVGRIGSEIDDVGVLSLDRADDRGEIGRRWWVGLVVDRIEPGFFQIDASPVSGVARRLAVIDRQRDRLQSELLLMGLDDLEKPLGDRRSRIRPDRQHREVFRVTELLVDVHREETDEGFVVLDDHR